MIDHNSGHQIFYQDFKFDYSYDFPQTMLYGFFNWNISMLGFTPYGR